ncbi:UNVERIFIED_CONTAM: hypothetical protein Scaly_3109100 [Sesamum calycinum]|uniref:Uncharacterized protein n=1 Tax=Sesamum calycinum TaxID=2727403 RepID=A0AAW2JMC1_9LAMI
MAERSPIAPSIDKPVIVRVRGALGNLGPVSFLANWFGLLLVNCFNVPDSMKISGLYEYDPNGRKAGAHEDAQWNQSLRHKVKKPAGTVEEVERHFGCESARLIMVGDRLFTDIVYGNRTGFFMILPEPLSLAEEPLIGSGGTEDQEDSCTTCGEATNSEDTFDVLRSFGLIQPNPSDELKSKEQNEKGRRDIKAWKILPDNPMVVFTLIMRSSSFTHLLVAEYIHTIAPILFPIIQD